MRDRSVAVVWAVGLGLAALVYLVGPDRFLDNVFADADRLAEAAQLALLQAGARAFDVVRALAIACFAIFFALSFIAAGRGQPPRGLLLIISLLFLVLVWHEGPEATGHWLLAFLLAAAGAASMTRRLSDPPPRMLPPRQKERL
jgi:hypothetical protein